MASDRGAGLRLIADIGGTNARLALQDGPGQPLWGVDSYECLAFATLADAVRHHLGRHGQPRLSAMALGVATPVAGDRISFTNNHWSFSRDRLQAEFGVHKLVVINDFAAQALALPVLAAHELERVLPGEASAQAPAVVIGPGTGLGVAALVHDAEGRPQVISGEGGHATLAAMDARESAVIDCLRQRFGHVSAERALSGPGLVNLYEAVAALAGRPVPALDPAEVVALARAGDDPMAGEALRLFSGFLGSVSGNLVLSFGALGGLYLTGGILPRLGPLFDRALFRQRLQAKGRLEPFLRPVPAWIVTAAQPGLLGAAQAL